jgi:Na+-transporting methylmalonyl-CoA/oxaloacetate decarboxylase beta subunit
MSALVKKYVALLGLRNTIGIIVAALLVAAATGWANPNASSQAIIGGHYNLQPIW